MTYIACHASIFELSLQIYCLSKSLKILAFNCKIHLALKALKAPVTATMLPFFMASAMDSLFTSAISLHPAVSSSQPVTGSTHSASTAVAGTTTPSSPEFLNTVVQAVKPPLAANQASVSHLDSSGNYSVVDQMSHAWERSWPGFKFLKLRLYGPQGLDFNAFFPGPGIFITG